MARLIKGNVERLITKTAELRNWTMGWGYLLRGEQIMMNHKK